MHHSIPGLSEDSEQFSQLASQAPNSKKQVRLPLFQLKTAAELGAMREICSGVRMKRPFERLIRARLQLVADRVELSQEKKSPNKTWIYRQAIRRRAQSVRTFAQDLEKPFPGHDFYPIGIIEPVPPVRQLLDYANQLEDCLKRSRPASSSRSPRRRPRPESRLVVELTRLVRKQKGAPCWSALATLLRRPVGIATLNQNSLKSLVRFHEEKAKKMPLLARYLLSSRP
jgi:hypothetical protein